jgi:hypothetical protein
MWIYEGNVYLCNAECGYMRGLFICVMLNLDRWVKWLSVLWWMWIDGWISTHSSLHINISHCLSTFSITHTNIYSLCIHIQHVTYKHFTRISIFNITQINISLIYPHSALHRKTFRSSIHIHHYTDKTFGNVYLCNAECGYMRGLFICVMLNLDRWVKWLSVLWWMWIDGWNVLSV